MKYNTNRITDEVLTTDGLSLLESSKELKKNYRTLPLTIKDEITDRLSPSESSREFEKIYRTCHC